MNDEEKIKKIAEILNDWNPLGDSAGRTKNLDSYLPEAYDIAYFYDDDFQFPKLKDKRKKTLLVVRSIINEAFNLYLTDDDCSEVSEKIYKIITD